MASSKSACVMGPFSESILTPLPLYLVNSTADSGNESNFFPLEENFDSNSLASAPFRYCSSLTFESVDNDK